MSIPRENHPTSARAGKQCSKDKSTGNGGRRDAQGSHATAGDAVRHASSVRGQGVKTTSTGGKLNRYARTRTRGSRTHWS